MRNVSIIHIGKTGGTALKALIDKHRANDQGAAITVFPHEVNLAQICSEHPDSLVAFFVRDPLERFISGFNSRLRKGQPRYNSPWSPDEARAFSRFQDANSLAEALSSERDGEREAAEQAILSIQHTRLDLVHYLGSPSLLEAEKKRILFIGEQRCFDTDIQILKRLLNIDSSLNPPTDDVGAHRNPAHLNRTLSGRAVSNLMRWYSNDYEIYAWCLSQRQKLLARYEAHI